MQKEKYKNYQIAAIKFFTYNFCIWKNLPSFFEKHFLEKSCSHFHYIAYLCYRILYLKHSNETPTPI